MEHVPNGLVEQEACCCLTTGWVEHEVDPGKAADQEAECDGDIQQDVIGQAKAEPIPLLVMTCQVRTAVPLIQVQWMMTCSRATMIARVPVQVWSRSQVCFEKIRVML